VVIRLKRAYEPPEPSDGYRVLVDRLWPRGRSREALALDAWLKDLAPSDALRRFFHHEAPRFEEFRARYERELERPRAKELLAELARRAAEGTVTLVYGARDPEHNQAAVLRDLLAGGAARSRSRGRPVTDQPRAAARSPRPPAGGRRRSR
jgi:uncharacterized protein YeaO (DUF488 family)